MEIGEGLDLFGLQESVNEAHRSLDCLWKQTELHLHHDEPINEDLAVFRCEYWLLLKVASGLVVAGFERLVSQKRLMNGLDVVALNKLSRGWHTQVIDDALSRLLERLSARSTLARGALAQL